MSDFDPQHARLKGIIIIFLFITCLYTAEFVFFGLEDNNPINTFQSASHPNVGGGILENVGFILNLVWGFFMTLIGLLTFTLPTIPFWMTIIMLPVMGFLWFILLYYIADLVYHMLNLVPFIGG